MAPSSQGTTAPNAMTLAGRVEAYLANLYMALDTPHQMLEGELRGDYLPGGLLSSSPGNTYSGPSTAPPTAPPFSAANRMALGDPKALALGAQSNVANLSQQFSNFGNQLKSASQRATLTATVQGDQAQLTSVNKQIQALQQQIANSSSSVVVGSQTLQQQLQALQSQAQTLSQNISNAQLQLAQLPPSPPSGTGPSLSPTAPQS